MQLHAGRSLGVGEERLLSQKKDQLGPLPKLEPDGPAADDGSRSGDEFRREVGAI